jgi:hypothetical protein
VSDARVAAWANQYVSEMARAWPICKRGERALTLCMPITCKRRNEERHGDEPNSEGTFTSFVYKSRWFVLEQTEGEDFQLQVIPEWDAKRAVTALVIDLIQFDSTDGNCQGFARRRQIAINPVAQLPHKTLFHELAHVVLVTLPKQTCRH